MTVDWLSQGLSFQTTLPFHILTFTVPIYSSADKTIKVWDIGARAAVSTVADTGEVWSVSWRPKPPALGTAGAFVTGGEDGVVKWWRGAGASTSA